MSDLTEERLADITGVWHRSPSIDEMQCMVAEINRHRAAVRADRERVRAAVVTAVDVTAVENVDGGRSSWTGKFVDAIADRVADAIASPSPSAGERSASLDAILESEAQAQAVMDDIVRRNRPVGTTKRRLDASPAPALTAERVRSVVADVVVATLPGHGGWCYGSAHPDTTSAAKRIADRVADALATPAPTQTTARVSAERAAHMRSEIDTVRSLCEERAHSDEAYRMRNIKLGASVPGLLDMVEELLAAPALASPTPPVLQCSQCGAFVHRSWDHLNIGEHGENWTCVVSLPESAPVLPSERVRSVVAEIVTGALLEPRCEYHPPDIAHDIADRAAERLAGVHSNVCTDPDCADADADAHRSPSEAARGVVLSDDEIDVLVALVEELRDDRQDCIDSGLFEHADIHRDRVDAISKIIAAHRKAP